MMSGDVTQMLDRINAGDHCAIDRLLTLVYEELRRIAVQHLRAERPGHTLQPTALVHEAYLKLVGTDRVRWESRAQFLAVGSQAIRRVLIDHARARGRAKRGGGARRVPLAQAEGGEGPSDVDLLELDDALRRLETLSTRQARLVELRFFGGLTAEEAAAVLGVSLRTVSGDWAMARTWLRRELGTAGEDRETG